MERIKWWIAYQLNRLAGQCWTDLVIWVLYRQRGDGARSAMPWRPISETCRLDAARNGCCYCGKIRPADETAVLPPVSPDPDLPGRPADVLSPHQQADLTADLISMAKQRRASERASADCVLGEVRGDDR